MDKNNAKTQFCYTLEQTILLKKGIEDLLTVIHYRQDITECLNEKTLCTVNAFNCELTNLISECIPKDYDSSEQTVLIAGDMKVRKIA